jgi:hypothetical protein
VRPSKLPVTGNVATTSTGRILLLNFAASEIAPLIICAVSTVLELRLPVEELMAAKLVLAAVTALAIICAVSTVLELRLPVPVRQPA